MSFIKEDFVNYFFVISSFCLFFLFKSNSEIYNLGLFGFIGISVCFLINYRIFFKNIDSLDILFLVLLLIIIASSFLNNELFFYIKRIISFTIGFLAFKYIKEKFSEKNYNFLFYLFNLILGIFSIFLLIKSYKLNFEIIKIVDYLFEILKPNNAIVHIVILLFITLFVLFRDDKKKIIILLLNLFVFTIVSILISSSTFLIILSLSIVYLFLSKFKIFKKIYLTNYLLIITLIFSFYSIFKSPNPQHNVSKIYNRLLFNYALLTEKEFKHHDIYRANNITYINDYQDNSYLDRSRFILIENDSLKILKHFMDAESAQNVDEDNFLLFNYFRKNIILKGKDYLCNSNNFDGNYPAKLIDDLVYGIFYPKFISQSPVELRETRKLTCDRVSNVFNKLRYDENLYILDYATLSFFDYYSLNKNERDRILYYSSLISDEYPVPLFNFGRKKEAECIDNKDRKLYLGNDGRIKQTKPLLPSIACYFDKNLNLYKTKNLLNKNDYRFYSIVVPRHNAEVNAPFLSIYYSIKQRVFSIKQHLNLALINPIKGLGNWVVSRDWPINDVYKWVNKSKPHNSAISFFQLHGIFALVLIILIILNCQIIFQKKKNDHNLRINSLYLLIFILLINLEDYFANAVFVAFYFYTFSLGLIFSSLRNK